MCLLCRNMRLRAFRRVEIVLCKSVECVFFQAIDSLALVVLLSLRHAPRRHCLKSHPKQASGCARVTGKAGENGQYLGEMGGSSPWTRPSVTGCCDTLKAPASHLGWGSSSKTTPGSLSTGSPAGRTPPMEPARCTVKPTYGQERCCGSQARA